MDSGHSRNAVTVMPTNHPWEPFICKLLSHLNNSLDGDLLEYVEAKNRQGTDIERN